MGSWITVVFPVNASITKSLAETAKDDQQLKIHFESWVWQVATRLSNTQKVDPRLFVHRDPTSEQKISVKV